MVEITGFIPALPTPITLEEKIDRDSLERLIEYVFKKGADGVFILGSMGEFATLTDSEKERLIKYTRDLVKGNKKFLVGVSDTGTQKVINNAKKAEMHGADAVVALPPFYYKLDQEAVYSFVKEVSQALNIPLLLYANYAQTGVSITFDTFRLISQLDNISGVKYSDSDMLTMVRLIKELKRPNFSILVGNEWLFGSAAMARVSGLVGGVTTLIPDVIKNLLEAAKRGEGSRVDQFQKIINKLLEPLTEAWVHEVKYALKLMGIFTEDRPCSPYIPIKPERKTVIMNVLKDIKLI